MSSGAFLIGAGYCIMFWDDTRDPRPAKPPKPPKIAIAFDELVGAGQIPPPFQSNDFRSAWEQWLKFREEIKKKLTASTAAGQIKMLVKLGNKALAIESIEQSIRNGWQGLFEPKKNTFLKREFVNDYSTRDEMDRKNREDALRL